MIESFSQKELEEKIDRYVNGQLSENEIDELWAELIQDDYYLDYLKSVANVKAVVAQNQAKNQRAKVHKFWSYAAAAVVALTIGVLTVLNYPGLTGNSEVSPIANIPLDTYRTTEGTVGNTDENRVIRNAISLANTGRFSEAVNLLKNELNNADNPKWIAEISLNLGSLYYNEGNYTEAASYFEKVKERKDAIDVLTLEKAYWYLGNAYFQLDDLAKAKSNIKQAYELNGAYRRVAKSYLNAFAD